jgi:hypothetical protein
MLKNYCIKNNATKTKNRIKGNKTKNHAIFGDPDLHIKFNIQVQKRI